MRLGISIVLSFCVARVSTSSCPTPTSHCDTATRTYHRDDCGTDLNDVPMDDIEDCTSNAGSCDKVQKIIITDCGIDNLDASEFYNVRQTVVEINLSNNSISTINGDPFNGMGILVSLDLSNNPSLPSIPPLASLDALEILNLAGCSLTDKLGANEFIHLKTTLKHLDLSNNDLTIYPSTRNVFNELSNLETLNLNNNQLDTVPFMDGKLTSLLTLTMENNQITVTDYLNTQALANLLTLDISNNPLVNMPDLSRLTRLRNLDLSECDLASLTNDDFSDNDNLDRLILSANNLENLPIDVFDHTPPRPITSLFLADNPNLVITNHLIQLQQLVLVELQGCAITTPPLFSNETKAGLETLRLDDNPITTIDPGYFNGMTALQTLHLEDTMLTSLPDLSGLSHLKYLYMQSSRLSEVVPSHVPVSPGLITANFDNNLLTSFPADEIFANCPSLTTLDLNNNPIETIANVTRKTPVTIRMTNTQVTLFCDCNVAWMKTTIHNISQPVTPCAWPPDLVGVDWDCELMEDSLRCYETLKPEDGPVTMKYEKLSEDEVTTEAQRLVAVPIVTTIQCMIKCGMLGGFCKTVNVVRNDEMLLCYMSVFGQPDTTEVAIAGFDDSILYKYAVN